MNRRNFLRASLLTSGALVIGVNFAGCASARARREIEAVAQTTGTFRPNAFVTIRPDSRVEVWMPKSEMGQGVLTSHAMLVAEELEVPMSQVDVFAAPAGEEYQTSFGGRQITGGSTSTMEAYIPMRTAAATAREMLLAAAAATWGTTRDQLSVADGVISQRGSDKTGSYGEFVMAASTQQIPEPKLKDPEDFKLLGKRSTRVDARQKATGTATFGMDVQLPDMLRAAILRPPVLGAMATRIDDAQALKVPGIKKIFGFERGVVVVAQKYWQTRMAIDRLKVEWSEGALQGFDSAQVRQSAAAYSGNAPTISPRDDGDVERALARDNVQVLDVVYEAPYLAHAPMEPMNCTAHYRGDELEIWAPTQSQTGGRAFGAEISGLPVDKVTLHTTFLGGGFGRRSVQDFVAEAVLIAMRFDQPVQLIWSREDDTQFSYFRPLSYHRMRAALDSSKKPVAWSHHSLSQSIIGQGDFLSQLFPGWLPVAVNHMLTRATTNLLTSGTVASPTSLEGARDFPYDVEHVRVGYTPVHAEVPVLFWRSVGHSFNGFVIEGFIDELAHAAGKDPFLFRRNLLKAHPRQKKVLEVAAQKAGWGKKKLAPGRAQGIAQHYSFGSYCAQVVEAGVEDGKIVIDRITCVIDCGLALNPDIVHAQMEGGIIYGLSAALKQEITFVDGKVQQANFDTYPALRMFESPEIEVHILNTNNPPTGVGEPGLPPAAPALANAIFAATGIRLRKMPFEQALTEALAERARTKTASTTKVNP